MSHVPRVAIVAHQTLVRYGVERVLSQCPELRITATMPSPCGIAVLAERPDAVVFNPVPDCSGTPEVIRSLAEQARVMVVSEFAEPDGPFTAVRAGALGCVTTRVDDQELHRAIRTVVQGGFHVSPSLASRLHAELTNLGRTEPRVLAPRELETLRLLADGLTHSQIARRMGLTEATVSTYVKRIRSKLNVGNKADLTRTAMELGLLRHRVPATAPA